MGREDWLAAACDDELVAEHELAATRRHVWGYVGRFDSPAGAGLLALDNNRQSFLYTRASGSLAPYGLYNY